MLYSRYGPRGPGVPRYYKSVKPLDEYSGEVQTLVFRPLAKGRLLMPVRL